MPLPLDPLLVGYLAAAGGPVARPANPHPWPVRLFGPGQQADYFVGTSGIYQETVLAVPYIVARSPLFTSHPEAGIDTRSAVPMRRRPGDQIEIHVGVIDPRGFPACGLALEVWTGEAPDRMNHWGREAVEINAATALIASYGIGRTLEAGPRFWYARLRFVGLQAVPVAPLFLVRWFISA